MNYLELFGWNSFFQKHWDAAKRGKQVPARVVEVQKDACRVAAESGVLLAEVAGVFRYKNTERSDMPAVGDWVSIDARPQEGRATIHEVLPRKTSVSRKAAGEETSEQIVATNIDTIFLVSSLNAELNLRRLERYLATIWESGAQPVILLNKADLCENPSAAVQDVARIAPGVPVHVISAHQSVGMNELGVYIQAGSTVALLGSSGVGKSTIINVLLGSDIQAVREIRESDDRGRHTTSYRKMFVLPGGGVLIDTPGMRELQLWDVEEGLDHAFDDIETLALKCHFRNCGHESESRCAVREKLASGDLDPGRFESYQKLKKELAYLARKQDALERAAHLKRVKRVSQALKKHYKSKE